MDALVAEYGEEDVMRWCETGRAMEEHATIKTDNPFILFSQAVRLFYIASTNIAAECMEWHNEHHQHR